MLDSSLFACFAIFRLSTGTCCCPIRRQHADRRSPDDPGSDRSPWCKFVSWLPDLWRWTTAHGSRICHEYYQNLKRWNSVEHIMHTSNQMVRYSWNEKCNKSTYGSSGKGSYSCWAYSGAVIVLEKLVPELPIRNVGFTYFTFRSRKKFLLNVAHL